MDVYKQYLYEMSKIEYQTPYLMVMWQYPPALFKHYIPKILNVPFEEPNHHIYYGEMKKICFSFMHHYSYCVSSAIKHCDRYINLLEYDEMMDLFNKTVAIHDKNHAQVVQEFQPINSKKEQAQLDEIITRYDNYKADLLQLGSRIYHHKKQKEIRAFTKDHFQICVQRFSQMGEFTCLFITKLVAERLHQIRVSLQGLLNRIQRNSEVFHAKYELSLKALFQEMYDRNKDSIKIARWEHRNSRAIVEVQNKIDTIRHKIATFGNFETFERLASEIGHWSKTLKAFDEIAAVITKVKTALDKAKEQQRIYDNYKNTGHKRTCCDLKVSQHIEDLEKKYDQACIPIITFFVCKGIDQIPYVDAVGSYSIDIFGHQNYICQFGAKMYHVGCDGGFIENQDNDKYYFDEAGRYLLENGEKIYQLAPCTPKFIMDKQGLFKKYVPCTCEIKCDHIDECNIHVYDMIDVEELPMSEPVDIKNTLDSETVKYLWDTFGYILPEVLCAVGDKRPKKPIYQLAHELINKKYRMTPQEQQENKKAAQEYRSKIFEKRREQAIANARLWKSKQFKRVKPEDLDYTAQELELTNIQEAEFLQQFNMENFIEISQSKYPPLKPNFNGSEVGVIEEEQKEPEIKK